MIPEEEVVDESKECGGDDLQVVVQQGQKICTSNKWGNFMKGNSLEWTPTGLGNGGMTCSRNNNKTQDENIQWELNNVYVNFQLITSSSNSYCPLQFTATFQHETSSMEGNSTSTEVEYIKHFKDSRRTSANNDENYVASRKGGNKTLYIL